MALGSYPSVSSRETTACSLPSAPHPRPFSLPRRFSKVPVTDKLSDLRFQARVKQEGGVMLFGAACRWGSAQGVRIIGEPK